MEDRSVSERRCSASSESGSRSNSGVFSDFQSNMMERKGFEVSKF